MSSGLGYANNRAFFVFITDIAKETGMSEDYIERISNSGIYPYAFQFGKSFTTYPLMQVNQTDILVKQQEIIKK